MTISIITINGGRANFGVRRLDAAFAGPTAPAHEHSLVTILRNRPSAHDLDVRGWSLIVKSLSVLRAVKAASSRRTPNSARAIRAN